MTVETLEDRLALDGDTTIAATPIQSGGLLWPQSVEVVPATDGPMEPYIAPVNSPSDSAGVSDTTDIINQAIILTNEDLFQQALSSVNANDSCGSSSYTVAVPIAAASVYS
jgi:hypothetical protein